MKAPYKRVRGGFTLVELLVVVTIIAILASMLVPAVFMALVAAKEGAITSEVGQLDAALRNYKAMHGEYPPSDFSDQAAVEAHVKRIFPRWVPQSGQIPTDLNPAQALVFWLRGYSSNPVDPFDFQGRTPLFDFDKSRFIPPKDDNPMYVPKDGLNSPYVYFRAEQQVSGKFSYKGTFGGQGGGGTAKPYKSNTPSQKWANQETFQIISAGLDGNYGENAKNGYYPGGAYYSIEDEDNITNFSEGTLSRKLP